jgi:hypothetical protein
VSTPADFAAPPAAAPAADNRGCLKKTLIGCGVLALLLAVCFIALVIYVRQKPEALTDMVMSQVESHFAPDVTAEEKEQLRAAYADFRTALREHRIAQEPLERMRTTLVSRGAQGEVSREQVRHLTEVFRTAAGSGGASASPPPGPSPALRATP